jgi:hypothetical protein
MGTMPSPPLDLLSERLRRLTEHQREMERLGKRLRDLAAHQWEQAERLGTQLVQQD